MTVRILQGDCRDVLKTLPDESVHCVVTSPPYWGLRDYGVPGQIGLEETPFAFVDALVSVFTEISRVLRSDGTAWLNLGDSYAGSWGAQSRGDDYPGTLQGGSMLSARQIQAHPKGTHTGSLKNTPGLKAKDLCLIPARVSLALQEAGWWIRQDIIWSKPNPMPHPNTDRCVTAHEYIFLIAKSERYYFDHKAIQEPAVYAGKVVKTNGNDGMDSGYDGHRTREGFRRGVTVSEMRNKRSVWEVSKAPFDEAHFATFPPALIEPCILAGCPVGGTVLDPFGGAGTTGLVADRLQRSAILIELNPEYAAMAEKRIHADAGMFAEVTT